MQLAVGLRRLLGVEAGEGALVVWSAAALFLVEWAAVAVSNASDTLFLKRVGVDYLPVVFLTNSVLLTATTFAAGRLAIRFVPQQLLGGAFASLALVLVGLWGLASMDTPAVATLLIIASKQIDVLALLLFWMVVSGLMSGRQSKRLVALMTAGGTVGTILGSFSSGPLGHWFGIPSLLGVAAVAFAFASLVTLPLGRSTPPRLHRGRDRVPLQEQQPSVRAFWRESSLFRGLVSTSFLAGALGPMLYFAFSVAADSATRTADGEQRLLELYSGLRGWINVGVLAVQVAGSAALFRRIGVPLAAAMAPAAYLLGFFGLTVRFGLTAAMPATVGAGVIDHTIYEPAHRVLGSLLPSRMRATAASLIQGPSKRAGAALGSLLILAVVAWGDPSHVALVALPLAGAWMVLALLFWRNYPNLLMEAASVRRGEAEMDWLSGTLDRATLRTLQLSLEGESLDACRAASGLFTGAPVPVAVEALCGAMLVAPARNRFVLVRTLDRLLRKVADVAEYRASIAAHVVKVLEEASGLKGPERANLLHILGRVLAGEQSSAPLQLLFEKSQQHADQAVRLAATVADLRCQMVGENPTTIDSLLQDALATGEGSARSIALAELRFELLHGQMEDALWSSRLRILVAELEVASPPQATDGSGPSREEDLGLFDGFKQQIIEAMADLALSGREEVKELAPQVLAQTENPDPRVRAAVLRFIGNSGLEQYTGLLAQGLSSRHLDEGEAARTALESFGPLATDALLQAVRHGGRRGREIASDMLREIRVDPSALRGCVDREIGNARELLLLLGALDGSSVSELVQQRLRERVDESVQAALEILSAIENEDRIAEVSRCLGRSWNQHDRAVLLEALESLLESEDRERILPLLEEHSCSQLAASAGKALGRPLPTVEQALVQSVASRDLLTVALLAATLEPAVLARVTPELDVEAARGILFGGETASVPGEDENMLSPVEKMLHLRTLDLFDGLTTRQLSELARVASEVLVRNQDPIVTEGDFDDSMYFIVSGTVKIAKNGRPVAELGAGDFFGEMSVFDGETRSATATAAGEVRLLRLVRNDLFEVMEDQPAIGIGICQTLVRRVRGLLSERATAQ